MRKRGLRYPCYNAGRQPLHDRVIGAVQELFAERWLRQAVPTEDEILRAVRRAMLPPVVYAACFRDAATCEYFAGPVPHYTTLLDTAPPFDIDGRAAYIVKITHDADGRKQDKIEPVARRHGGIWQLRQGM